MQRQNALKSYIYTPFWRAIDILLPPRCIGTGDIVSNQGMVSPGLWAELDFISAPYCKICGLSFEIEEELNENAQCAACIEQPPKYDTARTALIYNDASRSLLLSFKYGDQQHAAVTFATWMKNAAPDILNSADAIMPVPLHWRRLWQRRFNQSALLALALGRLTQRPVIHGLQRKRFTSTQKGLSRKERLKNVRMAFQIRPHVLQTIQGKHIVLVDDVMTSGATVNECAKVLKRHGAQKVSVLSVARVMRNTEFYPDVDDFNPIDEGY